MRASIERKEDWIKRDENTIVLVRNRIFKLLIIWYIEYKIVQINRIKLLIKMLE